MSKESLLNLVKSLAEVLGYTVTKKPDENKARVLKKFDMSKYNSMSSKDVAQAIEDLKNKIKKLELRDNEIASKVNNFMQKEKYTDTASILFEGTSFSPSRIILRDSEKDENILLLAELKEVLRKKKEKELVDRFKERYPEISEEIDMHVEVTPSGGALAIELKNGKTDTKKAKQTDLDDSGHNA